ncbi:hypothetical protein [Ferrimicrobium sp.]|uniref:hypothetical protein n=1 Tax=Ferrimicrobium sp. TaxID=2926050 RepID=UPI00260C7A06|nr:hypothetical protein [Ferrimicrobium sp.]
MVVSTSSAPGSDGIAEDDHSPEELLFREARRRQRRRRLIWAGFFVLLLAMIGYGAYGERQALNGQQKAKDSKATPVVDRSIGVLTCKDTTVVEPKSFVISCADGNTMLTKTRWIRWGRDGAAGTTDFAINLCNPSCFASRMSFFPGSMVLLSRPMTTQHGILFSEMVVRYRVDGKLATFPMSWKGEPAFEK